jgi:hypothetical protein
MPKMRLVAAVMMAGTLVLPAWATSTQTMAGGLQKPPIVTATDAPAGTETFPVKWVRVAVPKLGVMRAAVARPSGTGPFPAVLILHGTHGFARQYVEWANDLARGGFIAVAACWFSGGGGAGAYAVTPPIPCPEIPPLGSGDYPEAVQFVEALAAATRALPGVRRIGSPSSGTPAAPEPSCNTSWREAMFRPPYFIPRAMPYDRTAVPESSTCRFKSCMARLNPLAAEAQITMCHWRVTLKRRCGGIRKQSKRAITKEETTTASSSTRLSATMR